MQSRATDLARETALRWTRTSPSALIPSVRYPTTLPCRRRSKSVTHPLPDRFGPNGSAWGEHLSRACTIGSSHNVDRRRTKPLNDPCVAVCRAGMTGRGRGAANTEVTCRRSTLPVRRCGRLPGPRNRKASPKRARFISHQMVLRTFVGLVCRHFFYCPHALVQATCRGSSRRWRGCHF